MRHTLMLVVVTQAATESSAEEIEVEGREIGPPSPFRARGWS